MRILLPSDVFPPRSGGAGWSSHALALALLRRGHTVTALIPQLGERGVRREDVLGVPTVRYGYRAPPLPFVKNYWRHERLWKRLADLLVDEALHDADTRPLIIHAQHVQVMPAAMLAGRQLGAPVVVTVRDHWPWDYFATGLHGNITPYTCPSVAGLVTDLVARLGPLRGLLALPAIPYIQAHLQRRQAYLRQADAVIAVSSYIARRLAGIVAPERIHVIPNMIDVRAVAETAAQPSYVAPDEPFLLFTGKLEQNKGAQLLSEIFRSYKAARDGADWPALPLVVFAGSGPLRPLLERELAALGVRSRFLDWVDHDEVLRLMARCELLLFPSAWGDALSRVLLEASACGAPILAMPTGGTPDVIVDGVSGAVERTVERFAARMAALLRDPSGRRALGAGARELIGVRCGADRVVARVEALYERL